MRPIVEIKKKNYRGNKAYSQRLETIASWIETHQDFSLDELKYAIYLMDLSVSEAPIINYILMLIVRKIRTSSDWDDIIKHMSPRSADIKKAVWDKLQINEKHKLNNWKKRYVEELAIWGTDDNLNLIQKDLEACENIVMVEDLWKIYNKQAIRNASKRIISNKGTVIRSWLEEIDAS